MRRRTLLLSLAASGVAAAAPRMAAPDEDGLWVGTEGKLLRRVALRRPHLFSTSNDNASWVLWVETDRVPDGRWLFLKRGSDVRTASSQGSDGSTCSATFEVDRPTAEQLGAWLSAPVRERVPLGKDLQVRFEAIGGSRVRMTMRNDGDPVGVSAGGRQRGPRNNRFHFEVFRGDQRLPELEGWDFGGISGIQWLETGDEPVQEEDVARWADISAPGPYRVRCRYEATLMPSQDFPDWPERGHALWEPVYEGEIALPE